MEQLAERVMKRLSIPAREFKKMATQEKDRRQIRKSDLQASEKEKCWQEMQLIQTRREETLREAKSIIYKAGCL